MPKFVPEPIPKIKLPYAPKLETPRMPDVDITYIHIEQDLRDHTNLIIILCSCVIICILIAITFYCYVRKLVCFAKKPEVELVQKLEAE